MSSSAAGSIWCRTYHGSALRRFRTSTSSHGLHQETLFRSAPSDSVLCHFFPSIWPTASCLDGVVTPTHIAPMETTAQPSHVSFAMVKASDGFSVHGRFRTQNFRDPSRGLAMGNSRYVACPPPPTRQKCYIPQKHFNRHMNVLGPSSCSSEECWGRLFSILAITVAQDGPSANAFCTRI